MPDKDSPEWAEWAAEHPLHKAVCGNADAVVQQQRINQLMELIGKGTPRTKRVQFCRDNWGISDRQIEKILQKTNIAIRQCWEVEGRTSCPSSCSASRSFTSLRLSAISSLLPPAASTPWRG